MQQFAQQVVNGLSIGAIYALIAVGYTMVYGVLKLINFAHGEVFMAGAVAALFAVRGWGLDGPGGLAVAMLTAVVACVLLGLAIEFFAYRPLRDQPRLTALITAIGVSLLLQYGGQQPYVVGVTPQYFPNPWPALSGQFALGGVVFNWVDVAVLALTLVLMAGLSIVIGYTKPGLALRAVSHRLDTASLMGVNIDRTISFTFALGSALAAVGGVLYVVKFPSVDPLMGLIPGIKAFVAAVLGGIGNVGGAVVGALLLGLVETMVVGYVPNGSAYKDAVAFVILIVILLVKPTGLFGSTAVEKV